MEVKNKSILQSDLFTQNSCDEKKNICNYLIRKFQLEVITYIDAIPNNKKSHVQKVIKELLDSSNECNSNQVMDKFQVTSNEQSPLVVNHFQLPLDETNVACLPIANMLKNGCYADINIEVGKEMFCCHKDILCARSSYFLAMLEVSGRWTETRNNTIVLNDISPRFFAVFLCFIYGVFIDCRCKSIIDIYNLAQIPDMLGFDPMKQAVCFFLQRDLCHFFHKPCNECSEGIVTVLLLSEKYNMNELHEKCLKWCIKHSVRIWPSKLFCQLPENIHDNIFKRVENSLSFANVVNKTLEIDNICARLTNVSWTKPVFEMANRLMLKCFDVIGKFLYELASSKRIYPLFQGIGGKRNLHEEISKRIIADLKINNACRLHAAVKIINDFASEDQWNPDVVSTLKFLEKRTSYFILTNYFAIIHTEDWRFIDIKEKEKFKSNTICEGDPLRKPKRKPILSSSKKLLSSTQKTKPLKSSTTERTINLKPSLKSQAVSQKEDVLFSPLLVCNNLTNNDLPILTSSSMTVFNHSSVLQPPHITTEYLYEYISIPPTVFKKYNGYKHLDFTA